MKKILIFFLSCYFSIYFLSAKHIVGGVMTYKNLGNSGSDNVIYEIRVEIYRDCAVGNPDFDTPTIKGVGIYQENTKSLLREIEIPMVGQPQIIPNYSANPCVPPPTNICYEQAIYVTTVTLPKNGSGYRVTWARCCRNATIANIQNPGDIGMGLEIFIPPAAIVNNSPSFPSLPPTYICMGELFEYDHSAVDADGDLLKYSLVNPKQGGSPDDPIPAPFLSYQPYPPVMWQSPYSLTNIMAGTPLLNINANTGLFQVKPTAIGQFVVSVKVEEYRNGIKIDEITRDLQINVINCPVNFPPSTAVNPSTNVGEGDTLRFYAGEQNCFTFTTTDINGVGIAPDQVTVTAIGDIFGGGTIPAPNATFTSTVALSPITTTMCWQPNCNISSSGQFTIRSQDNNNCPGPNIEDKVFFYQILSGRATPPQVRCVSVTGTNQITVTWENPPPSKLGGFKSYILEKNSGNGWQTIATITDSLNNVYIDNAAIDANNISYCYRLSTAKICPTYFVGEPGTGVCSILVTATQVTEVQALVTWSPPYTGWSNPVYQVYAYENGGEDMIGSTTETSFLFTGCTFSGNFRIVTVAPNNFCTTYSGYSNGVDLVDEVPKPVDICRATVMPFDRGNQIQWNQYISDDLKYYRLFRSKKAVNDFVKIFESNNPLDTVFNDTTINVDETSYCYYIETADLCNNIHKSVKHCVVNIQGNALDYYINLKWNAYLGWTPSPSRIELWRTLDGVALELIATYDPSLTSFDEVAEDVTLPKYCYKLKAIRDVPEGCSETWSNEFCILFPPTAFYPNAFSPNRDGINDVFSPIGAFQQSFDLYIYDRWGRLIHHTQSIGGAWDGTKDGVPVPEGVYTYRVLITGYDGSASQRAGTVTLIR